MSYSKVGLWLFQFKRNATVDLQTGCFTLVVSGGGGVLLCSLKMVCSACLLHFLPALSSAGKQICKSPGVSQQDTRSASSPAALWHRLVVFVSFHWVRLYMLTNLLRLGRDFCHSCRHMGGMSPENTPASPVPARESFRDQFSSPLVTKYSSALEFSKFSFFFFLHVTFNFALAFHVEASTKLVITCCTEVRSLIGAMWSEH